MKTLREIFWNLEKYADKWDPYFDVYETWFSKYRGKSPRILEIGVQNGGSANMWLEYFGPGTKLVGIDIDPRCKQHSTEDIEIVIGDQDSTDFWHSFFTNHTQPFDIIIDDGGHRMSQMITSFLIASTHVKDGGIYLIEDTHTTYWPNPGLIPVGPWDEFGLYNEKNIMEFTKKRLDVLNREHIEPYKNYVPQLDQQVTNDFKNVKGVHFYNSMIVFEIGKQLPFVRCLNTGKKMS